MKISGWKKQKVKVFHTSSGIRYSPSCGFRKLHSVPSRDNLLYISSGKRIQALLRSLDSLISSKFEGDRKS